MTLSDLQKWRKIVPFGIFTACFLPWFLFHSKSLTEADLQTRIIVPALAEIAAFFYVVLDLRGPWWRREKNKHVGAQIRSSLLDIIPKDLDVTDNERRELAKSQVLRELTGVFWEAVDRNEVLTSHKEHFYSSGIEYSTAIDVVLICGFAGLCYAVAFVVFLEPNLGYIAAFMMLVALLSGTLAIPRARSHHLKLSAEQLELLRRKEGEFVSKRFREIVLGWRRARALP